MTRSLLRAILLLAAFPISMAMGASDDVWIPEQLRAWTAWVLHDVPDATCPRIFDDPDRRVCMFPSSCDLILGTDGARFTIHAKVFSEGPVELPGEPAHWPSRVLVDGEPVPLALRDGRPCVELEPGLHQIVGSIVWDTIPEVLAVPLGLGLIRVQPPDSEAFHPRIESGRIRLRPQAEKSEAGDTFASTVFRLVRDSVPQEIITLIRLQISGQARRIQLPNLLPAGSRPLAVDSPLPIGFSPQGEILVQSAPGTWDLRITSRFPNRHDVLTLPPDQKSQEVWALETTDHLRTLTVSGVPAVDPRTTDLPADWKRFQSFLIGPGQTMTLAETHRGAADPGPARLSVTRSLWLDFDGQGLTARDSITAAMGRDQSLAMIPPGQLERTVLNGEDQPVVLLGNAAMSGIVVRARSVELTAESRWPWPVDELPCSGWDRTVSRLSATLNLPPGYTVLAVDGADNAAPTWIGSWSLLDIFLVLVLAIGAWKARGIWSGLALLAFLVLAAHQTGAPVLLWAPILACAALLRLVGPDPHTASGVFWQRAIRIALGVSVLALILAALPFLTGQLRTAIYPQLEDVDGPIPSLVGSGHLVAPRALPMAKMESMDMAPPSPQETAETEYFSKRQRLNFDPGALVQTGPGLPDWSWRSLHLSWNGPVNPDQTMQLWILGPTPNRLLGLLRCLLLLAAGALIIRPRDIRPARSAFSFSTTAVALLALLVHAPAQARDFPDQNMLNTLKQRLLQAPPCFPNCLALATTTLTVHDGALSLDMDVQAQSALVMPLPRITPAWEPARVLVDGEPAPLVRFADGLRVWIDQGRHKISVQGPIASASLEIVFPVRPFTIETRTPGWTVLGLDRSGAPQGPLRLTRSEERATNRLPDQIPIPPFCEIQRVLDLGLEWAVQTQIIRRSPGDAPILVHVPLLAGESVLTPGLEVREGNVLAALDPGQKSLIWTSRLEQTPEISLQAPPASAEWFETWELTAASIWAVSTDGPPPVGLEADNSWRPVWKPWPGEKLNVSVSRPGPAVGPSLTIDHVLLTREIGRNVQDLVLTLGIRASRGREHAVAIPDRARDVRLEIDGTAIPVVRIADSAVSVPVAPGRRSVTLRWREDLDRSLVLGSPAVNLGHPAANVNLETRLPAHRWLLACPSGPVMGPAVLFWSYLAAILLVAAGLSRLPWTPLKAWQWFLLGLGLSQVDTMTAVLAVAWLPALGLRREHRPEHWLTFNLVQTAIVGLFLVGIACLYATVEGGLLGLPDMQVAGNGSSGHTLRWTQDRISGPLPQPLIVSVPIVVYRFLMLAWSLWMAWSLVAWIKWSWAAFGRNGIWMKAVWRKPRPKALNPNDGPLLRP